LEAVKTEYGDDYINGSHKTTLLSEGQSTDTENYGLITPSRFSAKSIDVQGARAEALCYKLEGRRLESPMMSMNSFKFT
jgi:hypothetical protein